MPHNKTLVLKYKTHLIVELYAIIEGEKYLIKCIHKDHDCSELKLSHI